MNAFLDSSALAKRYVEEAGSERVQELLDVASGLGVAVIAPTEVVSALCRRLRENHLTRTQYGQAKRALFEDLSDASVVGLTEQVVTRAVDLIERWPLRSSDALHVACAAEWSCELFVTADERQGRAAREYGLKVEDLPA
jgi:predicted nucleic acid-binding protein